MNVRVETVPEAGPIPLVPTGFESLQLELELRQLAARLIQAAQTSRQPYDVDRLGDDVVIVLRAHYSAHPCRLAGRDDTSEPHSAAPTRDLGEILYDALWTSAGRPAG